MRAASSFADSISPLARARQRRDDGSQRVSTETAGRAIPACTVRVQQTTHEQQCRAGRGIETKIRTQTSGVDLRLISGLRSDACEHTLDTSAQCRRSPSAHNGASLQFKLGTIKNDLACGGLACPLPIALYKIGAHEFRQIRMPQLDRSAVACFGPDRYND